MRKKRIKGLIFLKMVEKSKGLGVRSQWKRGVMQETIYEESKEEIRRG